MSLIDRLRSAVHGVARRHLRAPRRVLLAGLVVGAAAGGCNPPNIAIAKFDGGSVGGPMFRAPNLFTVVAIERLDSPMASRTTFRLSDGVPVPVTKATPEFLLARGRTYVPTTTGEPGLEPLVGLKAFDPARRYIVIVGPEPAGPFYRFDVEGGRAVRFGSDWPGGLLSDGVTPRPAPVFLDPTGTAHEMPFDYDTIRLIWGDPRDVQKIYLPPPPGS